MHGDWTVLLVSLSIFTLVPSFASAVCLTHTHTLSQTHKHTLSHKGLGLVGQRRRAGIVAGVFVRLSGWSRGRGDSKDLTDLLQDSTKYWRGPVLKEGGGTSRLDWTGPGLGFSLLSGTNMTENHLQTRKPVELLNVRSQDRPAETVQSLTTEAPAHQI